MSSDVARLREQIERECEAMQRGFYGFAITARHDVINHRYKSLDTIQQELQTLVGEQEATQILIETYIRVIG